MIYDVIVAGAGSAGCVLASRLSEDPQTRVLLLEAGGRDWNPLLRVPLMTGLLLRGRHANWLHRVEPEPNLNGRRLLWPRGKVLGGSSAINGMIYARGTPKDYDGWGPGWSFAEVLPHFKRSERHHRGESALHGGSGPLPVERPNAPNPLFDAFVAAGREAGHPENEDFNGARQEGFGRYEFTIHRGERWSAARAFLDPARGRPNLTIAVGAHASRIVIDRGRAVGVDVAQDGRLVRYAAEREIVLCCGTLNNPPLLMRSGLGDADRLRALGIPVAADLKGVGRNLRDHLLVRVEHACLRPITLYETLRADRAALALAQAMIFKSGPAASFPLAAGAFLKSDPALDEPDLQSHFLPGLSTAALRLPFLPRAAVKHDGHGFFANVYVLRPESAGDVTIRDPHDPFAAPVIRANYLSAESDRRLLRRGVEMLREVFAQRAFDPFRGEELSPGLDIRSDAALDAWIAATAGTAFHPIGTCRMGADDGAVVDHALKVRGVQGLRIADASIAPAMPSGNTNAPAIMIGEKAADLMLGVSGASVDLRRAPAHHF